MNIVKKIASSLMLAAVVAGSAQAQLSNTLYFQKSNFRTHFVNPSAVPDTKFYMGTPVPFIPLPFFGTIAIGTGNNSFCMADLVKNVEVNGQKKTVLCLDSKVPNGQKEFLNQISNTWNINTEMKFSLIDFGFSIGKKNFISIGSSINLTTDFNLPKEYFSLILEGVDYKKGLNLNIDKLGVNVNAYADAYLGYTRVVNEKLVVGGTFKMLYGAANLKTDFKDLEMSVGADEWTMSGKADVYMTVPTVTLTNEDGKLKDIDNGFDGVALSDFTGNKGFAVDLGATYKILPKLKLSASVIDLGYINYKNYASKLEMQQDFHFDGASLDLATQEADFDELGDSFENSFIGKNNIKYKQFLSSKIYFGAEYEVLSFFRLAALSKTTFAPIRTYEEVTLQGQLNLGRFMSVVAGYNIYDHQWNSVSAGANVNLGPFNFFAAVDNLPLRLSKVNDKFKIPAHLQYLRVNFGFGFVMRSDKDKKAKKDKKDKNNFMDTAFEEGPEADYYDADGDGVEDAMDRCPGTPEGVEVDNMGCPLDADSDGVPDYLDQCPDSPDGVSVDEKGCPVDTDKDGVPDYLDECGGTPEGVKVTASGCPVDTDEDGVPDYLDECPDTPYGAKVDAKGCVLDSDGDGVPDYLDKCPDVPGIAANNGCPEVKQEVKQLFRKALNGIQFQTGSATILKASYSLLDQIAKTMKENPDYNLYIAGHTDNVGNADLNLQLSKDRANSVMEYLQKKGVDSARMHCDGFGDTKPLVPNNSSANRAKNRRVEFEVEF